MRYLVLGDIHGNLFALRAVLQAATVRQAAACLFVGDLVGYGADPLGCIAALRDWPRAGRLTWVAGNHDLAARSRDPILDCIPEATQTITWTRQQLDRNEAELDFLQTAPTTTGLAEPIWLTHDSLCAPASGSYHRSLEQAAAELQVLQDRGGRVCFYGHTHRLRAEILDRDRPLYSADPTPHTGDDLDPHPWLLLPHQTAWIGVGSAGFPTNETRRAEFLILDTDDPQLWLVEKYAISYPRYATRAQIHDRLLPECSTAVVESIARWL